METSGERIISTGNPLSYIEYPYKVIDPFTRFSEIINAKIPASCVGAQGYPFFGLERPVEPPASQASRLAP